MAKGYLAETADLVDQCILKEGCMLGALAYIPAAHYEFALLWNIRGGYNCNVHVDFYIDYWIHK